jgi:GT2 family glycosyltransferase
VKISILLNTIDRYELTKQCLTAALDRANYDNYELLVCDNGSTDQRVISLVESFQPVYFRQNPKNEGNYQMLNQLMLRADGDAFCVIDNDIMLPESWLFELVRLHEIIPDSGVSGIECVVKNGQEAVIAGQNVLQTAGAVFGLKFFSKALVDAIGYFCEDYGTYGLGDTDFGMRAQYAGYENYYLAGMKSEHRGVGQYDSGEYRKHKTENIKQHQKVLGKNLRRYRAGDYYIAAPERI